MPEKLRGAEGREGPAGREGIPGREGAPGIDGGVGDKGDKGERGRALPRSYLIAFVVMALVSVGLVAGGAWVVRDVRDVQEDNAKLEVQNAELTRQLQANRSALAREVCGVANRNRAALRDLIIDARDRTRSSKQRTAEEKAEAEEFYKASLARLPADPCKVP